MQALSEYTFSPGEDSEGEISILELDPLELDVELEEPVVAELEEWVDVELEEPVDAKLDLPVAAGKPLPAWEPEALIMVLPFAVFELEDSKLMVVLKLARLKLEVLGKIWGKFVVVPTPTLWLWEVKGKANINKDSATAAAHKNFLLIN